MRKRVFSILLLLLGVTILYHLLFGRLFIFSPFTPGFEKKDFERATLYFHENESISGFDIIDSLITEVEKSHGLQFKNKVKIFICATEGEMLRYTGIRARMGTIIGNGRIFISEKANRERKKHTIHFYTYLLHELSHALMYQNMSISHALTCPQWFLEGLAVYTSDQFGKDGYLTREEAFEKMREGYFVEPEDWGTFLSGKGKTVKECTLKNKYRFIYSEFGSIIDDLVKIHGKEKFRRFMTSTLTANDFYSLFRKHFGIDFPDYLRDFRHRAVTAAHRK